MSRGMEQTSIIRPTILVIDDDPNTRTLLCLWVEELGLNGEPASSWQSGLSRLRLRNDGNPITGIVLDFHMPGTNGDLVLKELADRYPAVPVILTLEPFQVDTHFTDVEREGPQFVVKPVSRQNFQTACIAEFFGQDIPD